MMTKRSHYLKKLENIEEENRSLKEEMRKRDFLFVEVLEEMKHKLDRIEEHQQQLAAPLPVESNIDVRESSSRQKKRHAKFMGKYLEQISERGVQCGLELE